MAPKGKKRGFDWQCVIDHKERTRDGNYVTRKFFVQGDKLGASGESMLSGAIRENNIGRAEIALLGNTVRVVKVDGKSVFNRDKGQIGADIPSPYDPDRDQTLRERLLIYIVTKIVPHISDQYEDLAIYYDEEEVALIDKLRAETVEEDPTLGSRIPEEPSEFHEDAETLTGSST